MDVAHRLRRSHLGGRRENGSAGDRDDRSATDGHPSFRDPVQRRREEVGAFCGVGLGGQRSHGTAGETQLARTQCPALAGPDLATLEERLMNSRYLRSVRWSAVVGLLSVGLSAQGGRPIALDDLTKLKSVGDPQVSPDGKWVAYTVGTIDAEKDKRDTDLWMASWDGAEQLRLTATNETSESSPRWSPDNRYLAFLTTRGDESQRKNGAQVWLLNRAGGEAQQLTEIKGGVSDFVWSPDSKRLVLVVKDPDPDDDPEKKDGWKRKTTPPIVIDRYRFKQDIQGFL